MRTEKYLNVSVEAEIKKGNQTIKNKLEAKIDTGYGFGFQSISEFQKDMKRIDRYIKKLTRDGIFFEMEVSISEYEIPDDINNLKTTSFDLWKFMGYNDCPEDESEMGILLSPDTRYTEEYKDAWYVFTLDSLPHV